MRELRVVGLGEDTSTVILEDPIRHERFVVPSDERLRAAARGDVRRLGQMEIETTSPLRPRDIQARIRGGESVADVAAGAGVPAAHVERFAYPVLLERSRVAEMAGRGHPLAEGGTPDPRSLLDILTATFSGRGQDLADGSWDAWKGEDGGWIVAMSWQTGHSDHLAHWTFTPGSGGGLVAPRDEPARDLMGLAPASGPRRADGTAARGAEVEDAGPAPAGDDGIEHAEQADEHEGALAVGGGVTPSRATGKARPSGSGAPSRGRGSRAVPDQRGPDQRAADQRPAEARGTDQRGTERRSRDGGRGSGSARHRGGEGTRPEPSRPEPSRPESRPDPGRDDGGGDDPERGRSRARGRNHPIVPSWEDVLLGVRSPRS
ncbi:DUF3071 domain-containing protein [Actinomycetospora endophytica]|uniref:DUF3071 domain-containing protein n=1 Tax=Actinomycetospora endophytica TaxID=2291215 RepID=A0ABS8P207_9PSEU|nr:septation protein SepH [Actinomycetospora endophytica]MCD2192295.1 DUF3071 domain-containing protein [Actinomycetospora endophytica]